MRKLSPFLLQKRPESEMVKDYISIDQLMASDFVVDASPSPKRKQKEITTDQSKSQEMYDSIVVLLDNLLVDPDKPTINWPNRGEQITAFKKKLQSILNRKA